MRSSVPLSSSPQGQPRNGLRTPTSTPDTVRRWLHDFRQHGMLGLFPAGVTVEQRRRGPTVSEAVCQAIDRLKALYGGFHARELARILFLTLGERIDHKTAQRLWRDSPVVP
jgi:hypothetical protein